MVMVLRNIKKKALTTAFGGLLALVAGCDDDKGGGPDRSLVLSNTEGNAVQLIRERKNGTRKNERKK
jgi:hypothetical protein